MDADVQKKLREAFDEKVIGKLPRVWCGKCREAIKNRHPSCDEHQRAKCATCKNNMTTAHLHLDYVGHAAITDRLLQVDSAWAWEPVAFGPDGLPLLDKNGGLWIRLTVAGVTRLGYGDAEGKTGPAAIKEAIGDALRNGAMRFGVGLDLWHKDGPLQQDTDSAPAAPSEPSPAEPTPAELVTQARSRVAAACAENGWDRDVVAALYSEKAGHEITAATDPAIVSKFRDYLYSLPQSDLMAPAGASNGAAQ